MSHDHMHMGHSDHESMCSMNMLFTWDTTNLCIVFPGWRVNGTGSLILSLIAVVALTAGYELVRELSRRYEANATPAFSLDRDDRRSSRGSPNLQPASKAIRGLFYAVQVFYSFFVMLVFMTYNGWVMLAVAVGAFLGFVMFSSNTSAAKNAACH